MKKVYRRSQMRRVLGKHVSGLRMHKYGLPYDNAGGIFSDIFGPNSIDLMLAAVECYYPEIHVTSAMPDGRVVNRYEEGAMIHLLYTGNCDPEIEFANEFSLDDFTAAELAESARIDREIMSTPPTLEALNAVQWLLDKTARERKK